MIKESRRNWGVFLLLILAIFVVLILTFLISSSSSENLESTTLTAQQHSLGFSIYTGLSSLLPKFKIAYASSNSKNLLIDDNYKTPPRAYLSYWNKPQVFPRMVIATNYTELTSNRFSYNINNVQLAKAFNFTKNDYLGYDPEDWALTPAAEQNAQASYTQMACNYVHNAGYKFAYTPEIDVPGWGQFSQVNWNCVDLLDLQEQFNSGNTNSLIKNVTQMLAVSKAVNSNLVVFVQIKMGTVTQSTMESDIKALASVQGVNGVMIEDECSTSSCNSTLLTLVNYTKAIVSTSTTTTSTTTSRTTTSTTSIVRTCPDGSTCPSGMICCACGSTGVYGCRSTTSKACAC